MSHIKTTFDKYNVIKYDYLHLKELEQRGGASVEEVDYLLRIIETELEKDLSEVEYLEVGGGNFCQTLGMAFHLNSFTGIEKSKRAVRFATRTAGFQRIPNVTIIDADIAEYDLDREFDVIYMRNSLHLANYDVTFPKLIQSLRPGGVFVVEQTDSKPVAWGDKRYVRDHPKFDEGAWNEWKERLDSTLEYVEREVEQNDNLELKIHTVPYVVYTNHLYVIKKH